MSFSDEACAGETSLVSTPASSVPTNSSSSRQAMPLGAARTLCELQHNHESFEQVVKSLPQPSIDVLSYFRLVTTPNTSIPMIPFCHLLLLVSLST